MEDYLKSGGVKSNLEILSSPPLPSPLSPGIPSSQTSRENLFLQGYGRQWGEKLTYSVGLAYGTGTIIGGSYGLIVGLRRGGATRKLFLNSVLNSTTTHGPGLANQAAVITMFYCGFNNLIQLVTDTDEVLNSTLAGALSGGVFKLGSSWLTAAKFSAASAGIFTALDFGFRHGYF
eukprot:GHVS01057274.1.p1 GENE.GHVS01057274.1~~GHVS01057274.1.p1  ORF type:complete len:200 (-),score=26.32 GHVS01057274.1:190-717(-)